MRTRILLVISGTLVVMMVILFTVTRAQLLESFSSLERHYAELDAERLTNAIAAELSSLSSTNQDWSGWDATYDFVRTEDQRYVTENVTDSVFENLRLNALLFLDVHGRIVLGRSFDSKARMQGDIPQSLAAWLAAHAGFTRFTATDAHREGTIGLPEGALLAVSRPILHSNGEGPVGGALVMGRFLDDQEARRLGETLRLSLAAVTLGNPRTAPMAEEAARTLAPGDPPLLDTSREDTLSAYTILWDVDGKPALALRVDAPRDIHRQAELTIRYLSASLLLIAIVFWAAVLILLERAILSRLLGLSKSVLAIGTGGDPSRRVSIGGKDQIAYLGAAINGMLDALAQSTEQLRASERRNEAFLDAVPDVIFRITREGAILDARSPEKLPLIEAANDLVGKDSEQILPLYAFISPEHFSRSIAATKAALDTGMPQMLDYHVDVAGARRWYTQRFVPSGENEAIVLVREVTSLRQAEEARRKEVLLKEIHHRVKNNLQVISSLLALQAGATTDPRTRALLAESRDRVKSMALIHEKLYQTGDERGVSFEDYVRDLAAHLRHSYAGNSAAIAMDIDVEEVTLDMDLSVPCGLIITELLSNALKHAFPDGRRGTISVRLRRTDPATLALTISDDGVGFPPEVDFRNAATLGLRIVRMLVEQIRGALTRQDCPGAAFTITFPAA